jgi:ankyrin repeat protein
VQLGGTALEYAVANGHMDVVQLLLAHPQLDVNVRDNEVRRKQ